MTSREKKEPGTFSVRAGTFSVRARRTLLATLLSTLVACAPLYIAPSQRTPAQAEPTSATEGVVYAFGDMGAPTPGLADVTAAMAKELAADHAGGHVKESPLLLGLGDNLYEVGLPRPGTGDTAPIRRLGRIADLLARCRFGGRPAPLVLVPGNHDYGDRALPRDRDEGDITRWYYLDDLGIGGVSHWTMLPGERPKEAGDAAKLYERLYEAPERLSEFMRPRRIPHTPASLAIVAIDSQLLIDLFAAGRDDLAARYLEALDRELARAASARWRLVATHHPVESYGAHHVTMPARFLLGPGWRQFRSPWEVVLAIPPLGTLATTVRWAIASNQDSHSSANRAYRKALLERLERHHAAVVLSGHDHNSQLIELDAPGGSRSILQVVSGVAAKLDPVTRGNGTLFYHSGYGYTRLAVHATHLEIAFKDRSGATLFRYRVASNTLSAGEGDVIGDRLERALVTGRHERQRGAGAEGAAGAAYSVHVRV